MTNTLAGKVAVITGASTGIGLAAAKRFIREGMDRVFITGRPNALDAAVPEIGEKATGIPGDVASLTDVDRLYEAVKRMVETSMSFSPTPGLLSWLPSETSTRKFSTFTSTRT